MQGLPYAVRGSRDWLNALTYSVQSPPSSFATRSSRRRRSRPYNILKEQIPGWARGWDAQDGKTEVDVSHDSRGRGEFGTRDVAGRLVSYHRQGQRMDDVQRPTKSSGMCTCRSTPPHLIITADTGPRRQSLRGIRWSASMPKPVNASGTTSSCITGCGTTTRPPRQICSTSPSTAAGSARVAQVTKQGFVFTFDRVTGEPVWPNRRAADAAFRRIPASTRRQRSRSPPGRAPLRVNLRE